VAATQLEPNRVFAGRYRIERFLAEGGYGAVYVAEQLATEAKVAIKVLWPHVLQSRDAVEKFQQEARIAGRVNSEHIVRVLDAGFDDNTQMPFLVMELLVGEDLERVVSRAGCLPAVQVVSYLRQVASALDKAHAHKSRAGAARPIVHRDLKPENLFLTQRESGEALVKVLDFGIAKVLTGTSNMSREVKGTPLFMAFEQASGGAITPQTDIWALGLIAAYLLSGHSYWRTPRTDEGSLMGLFAEVLQLPLESPTLRLGELGIAAPWPASFDEWFGKCVNREPTSRFASAGEAISALVQVFGFAPSPYSASNPALPVSQSGPHPVAISQSSPANTPVSGDFNGAHFTPPSFGGATPAPSGATMPSADIRPVGATSGKTAQGLVTETIRSRPPPKKRSVVPVVVTIAGVAVLATVAAAVFVVKKGTPQAAVVEETTVSSEPATSAPPAPSAGVKVAPLASAPSAEEPSSSAPAPSAEVARPSPPRTASPRGAPAPAPSSTKPPSQPKTGRQPGLYDDR
jgi:eukaryotic-like serine/threonine-protein kinase